MTQNEDMEKTFTLTHPEKILFPKSKITKKELADYYETIAPQMLSHLRQRPISMERYPHGIKGTWFFQKQITEPLPSWIHTADVKRKEGASIRMLLCENKASLLWLANRACITPHIWLSRIDKPRLPDRMVFDIDPPSSSGFPKAIEAALSLKNILETYKLQAFVSTTGSRGLHVMIPIRRKYDFDRVRAFARSIAEELVEENPSRFTIASRKEARKGRVYIDVLRNGYAQTVVAPYSIRAIEGAPIAMPLFWEELQNTDLHSQSFTLQNSQTRLRKKQPWRQLLPQTLPIS